MLRQPPSSILYLRRLLAEEDRKSNITVLSSECRITDRQVRRKIPERPTGRSETIFH